MPASTDIVRETYGSSLEMAATVLRRSGMTPAAAREAVRRFRSTTRQTLAKQYPVKEDDTKFLATSREAAQQLEKLFETDREQQVRSMLRMDEARQVRDFWFGKLPLEPRRSSNRRMRFWFRGRDPRAGFAASAMNHPRAASAR